MILKSLFPLFFSSEYLDDKNIYPYVRLSALWSIYFPEILLFQ